MFMYAWPHASSCFYFSSHIIHTYHFSTHITDAMKMMRRRRGREKKWYPIQKWDYTNFTFFCAHTHTHTNTVRRTDIYSHYNQSRNNDEFIYLVCFICICSVFVFESISCGQFHLLLRNKAIDMCVARRIAFLVCFFFHKVARQMKWNVTRD